ncbi:MAG: DUF6538 domain-containing protein [Desulfovibrio aminophilus]|uniref:DUF6538 domain-containing protein n=1 Tax=Desulfovibrio aminophilus TaxID=81425 RepID=UPI0039EC495F
MPKCQGVTPRKGTNKYHYRRRIPQDLVAHYGRKELSYSLETSDYRTACEKARLESVKLDQEFAEVRRKLAAQAHPRTSLTTTEVDRLAALWLHRTLADDDAQRLQGFDPDRAAEVLAFTGEDLQAALAAGDLRLVRQWVDDLLEEHGLALPPEGETYKRLCLAILKAEVRGHQLMADRLRGMVVDTPPAPAPLPGPAQTTQQSDTGITLGKAVDLYLKGKKEAGEWQNGTEYKEGVKVRLFAEILGQDRALASLTVDDMREVKAALLRFPANRNKLAPYRDMTVAQVLKAEVPEEHRLQPTTLKNYFNKIGAFLKWAKKNRYHSDPSIATDILTIKTTKQDHEYRSPLTSEDIRLYFAPETFLKATENSPALFWVSVLGLFTGARIEELCQLYLSDIVQEDGVWCFALRPDRPDKHMKNLASRRFTPIAPFLIHDLNFLAYVDKLKAEGHERLFPELSPYGAYSKYSHYVSRRLGEYRAKIGLRADASGAKKDFHSFRGTVAQWCEEHSVPEKLAARIIGHKHRKMTYGRYTTDTRPSVMLREVVSRLDFGVDLSHLKRSPHVVQGEPKT